VNAGIAVIPTESCTLVIPARTGFQLVNNAATPMQLVSVFLPAGSPEVIQP